MPKKTIHGLLALRRRCRSRLQQGANAGKPAGRPRRRGRLRGLRAASPTLGRPGASVDLTGIAKAEGGSTIAEVFAQKDQLAGKNVLVRGKVVKVSPGIMGKNWVHVRDGTGPTGQRPHGHDRRRAKVGDTVLVTGRSPEQGFRHGLPVRRHRRGRRREGGVVGHMMTAWRRRPGPPARLARRTRPGSRPAFFFFVAEPPDAKKRGGPKPASE